MKMLSLFILTAAAVVGSAGCGSAPANSATPVANTTNAPAPERPTVEGLKALEVKAFEAYRNRDTAYFETYLGRDFVYYDNGRRVDKAAVIKQIGGHKNDIKSFTFSGEKLTKLDPETAILTMKAAADGKTADGKKFPYVISATLFVRQGADWQAAWHGEIPVVDPTAPPAAPKAGKDKSVPKAPPADRDPGGKNAAVAEPMPNATDALVAIEREVWEAWMKRDGKRLDELTAKDLAFVNIFGGYFASRADTLKEWTEHKCEIKSVGSSDAQSVPVTNDTAILFHKGTADGTCFGQKVGPIYGTSVYVKEGEAWKLAFTMNVPAA